MDRCTAFLLGALWLLPITSGCEKKAAVVPVSGRVTLDERPLANAVVRFQPAKREGSSPDPESYGRTDADGNFTLKPVAQSSEESGAVPGEHLVQVSVFDRDAAGPSGPRETVPAKYNRDSQLRYTVPPQGTKEANLKLTSR